MQSDSFAPLMKEFPPAVWDIAIIEDFKSNKPEDEMRQGDVEESPLFADLGVLNFPDQFTQPQQQPPTLSASQSIPFAFPEGISMDDDDKFIRSILNLENMLDGSALM